VLLSDANYIPNAAYETTGYLGDGFSDLTGGSLQFQTCYDAADCNTDSGGWALEITLPDTTPVLAPEPMPISLAGLAFGATAWCCLRRRRFGTY
jgi:hypothetical protein